MRKILGEIRKITLRSMAEDELFVAAKELQAPYDLVSRWPETASCPWCYSPPAVSTPADAAMMMQLGADGVFVGSGIFKSGDEPVKMANAIVQAQLRQARDGGGRSRGLGEAMVGLNDGDIRVHHRLEDRGW